MWLQIIHICKLWLAAIFQKYKKKKTLSEKNFNIKNIILSNFFNEH